MKALMRERQLRLEAEKQRNEMEKQLTEYQEQMKEIHETLVSFILFLMKRLCRIRFCKNIL